MNELVSYALASNNLATYYTSGVKDIGTAAVGQNPGLAFDAYLRFPSIIIPQGSSVSYARLYFHVHTSHDGGAGNLKYRTKGIDVDNCDVFSLGDFPNGRAETSAYVDMSFGAPPGGGDGAFLDQDVSSIVNEIVQRGSWSSGNAIGFGCKNNTSTDGYWIYDTYVGTYIVSFLAYRVSAEPDTTPTPTTIDAPTFPATADYGLKISAPGVDVKTATEAQLYYTSRKSLFKVNAEDEMTLSESRAVPGDFSMVTQYYNQYAHGLGYFPAFLAFGREAAGSNCYQLGGADMTVDGTKKFYGPRANDTLLDISASATMQDALVRYYVFMDPVET